METNVKIIADSISSSGHRITTFELVYPRIILSELNTHRIFSKNSSSSRAIPVSKVIQYIKKNPFIPNYWGKSQKGMQASSELQGLRLWLVKRIWSVGISLNLFGSSVLNFLGLHKQLSNRNTEYASYMKTIVTSTDFSNFFDLRAHIDAQPEIQELALKMQLELFISKPEKLRTGEWHTPYIEHARNSTTGELYYGKSDDGIITYKNQLTLNDAKCISVSCCAQVSYRALDVSIEKAISICKRLAGSVPIHSSPFEHVATPAPSMIPQHPNIFSMGITGYNIKRVPVSGNSVGWIQFRHCIDEIQLNNMNE